MILLEYFKLGKLTVDKFFIEKLRILFDISGYLGVPEAFDYCGNELSILNNEFIDRRNHTLNKENILGLFLILVNRMKHLYQRVMRLLFL